MDSVEGGGNVEEGVEGGVSQEVMGRPHPKSASTDEGALRVLGVKRAGRFLSEG